MSGVRSQAYVVRQSIPLDGYSGTTSSGRSGQAVHVIYILKLFYQHKTTVIYCNNIYSKTGKNSEIGFFFEREKKQELITENFRGFLTTFFSAAVYGDNYSDVWAQKRQYSTLITITREINFPSVYFCNFQLALKKIAWQLLHNFLTFLFRWEWIHASLIMFAFEIFKKKWI